MPSDPQLDMVMYCSGPTGCAATHVRIQDAHHVEVGEVHCRGSSSPVEHAPSRSSSELSGDGGDDDDEDDDDPPPSLSRPDGSAAAPISLSLTLGRSY